jgi:hypothetical protein
MTACALPGLPSHVCGIRTRGVSNVGGRTVGLPSRAVHGDLWRMTVVILLIMCELGVVFKTTRGLCGVRVLIAAVWYQPASNGRHWPGT